MKPYSNLPPAQRRTQQLVEQFNADEQLWRFLEGKRRQRRRLCPHLSAKRQSELDLLEFGNARPVQDCVAYPKLLSSHRQPKSPQRPSVSEPQPKQSISRKGAKHVLSSVEGGAK